MKRLLSLHVAAALLMLARPAPAAEESHEHLHDEDAPRIRLTPEYLNDLAWEAHKSSLALRAARARTDAARAGAEAVRTWDDPMVMLGGMAAPGMMRAEEGDLIYGVEQAIPLFGKPRLARKAAEAEVAVAYADEEFEFQQLRRDIAVAAFKAALAARIVEVQAQDLEWLDLLTESARQRHQTGDATQVDLWRAQSAQSLQREAVRASRDRLSRDEFTLNRLMNRPMSQPWPALELPEPAIRIPWSAALAKIAVENEPRIRVMEREIEQAAATAGVARRARLPDVRAGVEGRTYTGDGGFRQGMLYLSMNVPWFNSRRYGKDAGREEARLRVREQDLAQYTLLVAEEIHHLTLQIDAARREALLYRDELIPRAEEAVQSARASWIAGRVSFNDLLEIRRMRLDSQLMYARAVTEQYELLSELVLCCGLGDLAAIEGFGENPDASKESQPDEH